MWYCGLATGDEYPIEREGGIPQEYYSNDVQRRQGYKRIAVVGTDVEKLRARMKEAQRRALPKREIDGLKANAKKEQSYKEKREKRKITMDRRTETNECRGRLRRR